MKKSIVLLIVIVLLAYSVTAFALTPNYNQTITFSPNVTVGTANPLAFTFSGLTAALLDATLTLDATSVTNGSFKISGSKNFGVISVGDSEIAGSAMRVGSNTFSSGDETLDLLTLNGALANGKLGLTFEQLVGTTTLKSATLSGTVAPEPASMVLVAVGLVGLPIARKLRRNLL